MNRNATLTTFAATFAAAVLAGTASAAPAPAHASLVIRHQLQGCHSWSVNGGAFKPTQSIAIRSGGWVSVTDDDMMPHTLVQIAGPAAHIANLATPFTGLGKRAPRTTGAMTYMGSATKVQFPRPGVYRFSTKAGEDYVPTTTTGADNVLRLTVHVSA